MGGGGGGKKGGSTWQQTRMGGSYRVGLGEEDLQKLLALRQVPYPSR